MVSRRSGQNATKNTNYTKGERDNQQDGDSIFAGKVYENDGDYGPYLALYMDGESVAYLNEFEKSGDKQERQPDYQNKDGDIKAYIKTAKDSGKQYLQIKFYDNEDKYSYSYRAVQCAKKSDKSPDYTIFKDSKYTKEDAEKDYPKKNRKRKDDKKGSGPSKRPQNDDAPPSYEADFDEPEDDDIPF